VAKQSLFSILTDLPWWASLLVAALVYSVGSMFSPLIGGAAALPFLGVAAYVGFLRLRRGPTLDVPALLKALRAASPEEMHAMLTDVFRAQRYALSDAAEGDLKLERNGYVTLVRFRRWRAQSAGAAAVKELKAAMQSQQADHGMYITAGVAADGTRDQASKAGITLIDGPALAAMLGRTSGARKALVRANKEAAKA
jgi:Restriction endonuclease